MRTLFISFIIAILILFLIQRRNENFIDFQDQDTVGFVIQKGSIGIKNDKVNECVALLPDTEVVIHPSKANDLQVKYYEDVDCSTEALTNESKSFYKITNLDSKNVKEQPPMEPSMEQPTMEQPPMEPTMEQPPMEQPTMEQPTMEQPTMEQPTMEEPTTVEGFSNLKLAKHF